MKHVRLFLILLIGIPAGAIYWFSAAFMIMGYFMAPYGSMIQKYPYWNTVANSWVYPVLGTFMISFAVAVFFTLMEFNDHSR
jgi:hypothetical protein